MTTNVRKCLRACDWGSLGDGFRQRKAKRTLNSDGALEHTVGSGGADQG